jgi:glycosyltransferase involved in cell wall biosynthesis
MSGSACFIVPGPLDAATGGTIYDRRIIGGLRAAGWCIETCELPGPFPESSADARGAAEDAIASLPDGSVVVADGLAFDAVADVVGRESRRIRLVALVHLPFAADPALEPEARAKFGRRERRVLEHAVLTIVTGDAARPLVEHGGASSDRVVVIEPGVDPATAAQGSRGGPVQLVCVATLNRIKGHDVLLRSLGRLREMSWRLTCAGSTVRDPAAAEAIRRTAAEIGLNDRVSFAGELGSSALDALLDTADVFVAASRFETYGMAAAEALAHGLPIVSTRTGAIASLVGSEAGLLVDVGDEDALTDALRCVIGDESRRAKLRHGALRVRPRLQPWSAAVSKFAAALSDALVATRR